MPHLNMSSNKDPEEQGQMMNQKNMNQMRSQTNRSQEICANMSIENLEPDETNVEQIKVETKLF